MQCFKFFPSSYFAQNSVSKFLYNSEQMQFKEVQFVLCFEIKKPKN